MTSQINNSIAQVNSRAEQSPQRVQQSSNHSNDVSAMTMGLKGLVDQFRT